MNFYYSKDGQSFGPLPLEVLINIIDKDTLVWNEDGSMPDWQPAATVPAIVSFLTPSAPSSVVPPVPEIAPEPEEELSDEMKDLLEMEEREEEERIFAAQSTAPSAQRAEHGIPIKLIFKGGLLVMGTMPIKVLVDGVLVGESTINRGISLDFKVNSTRPRIKVDTTILDLPDLIIDKSYEIHVKYGQTSGGFFEGQYGILPKPTSIITK
jgi:hypothetical protein